MHFLLGGVIGCCLSADCEEVSMIVCRCQHVHHLHFRCCIDHLMACLVTGDISDCSVLVAR